jgi:hypothetical protein
MPGCVILPSLIVTLVRLAGAGGVRSVVAESLLCASRYRPELLAHLGEANG